MTLIIQIEKLTSIFVVRVEDKFIIVSFEGSDLQKPLIEIWCSLNLDWKNIEYRGAHVFQVIRATVTTIF